jgi:glycosyltransferase involved in cell wall biosynthesis
VTTVLLAADPVFTPRSPEVGSAEAGADAGVLRSYGLEPGAYLFFPAHTWHHKNHRAAIDALRVLRDRHGMNRTLVCTGGAREAQPAIEAQIVKSGMVGRVRFLGYCPERDLPALYRGAACLLFPSLFEGFGMPVLEAMASGCPVVCSNTTSLPEIAGEAALLVDPSDPEAIATAVHRVLTDPDLRAALIARGLRRAATFSWQRHTLETIAVLSQVHTEMRTV